MQKQTREAKSEVKGKQPLRDLILLKVTGSVTRNYLAEKDPQGIVFTNMQVKAYGESTHDNFQIDDFIQLRSSEVLNPSSSIIIDDNEKALYQVKKRVDAEFAQTMTSKDAKGKSLISPYDLFKFTEYFMVEEYQLVMIVTEDSPNDESLRSAIKARGIQARLEATKQR